MILMAKFFFAVCGLILSLFGSGLAQSKIIFEDAYIRAIIPGQRVTAAYLRLKNESLASCRFVSVSADIAERAEFHSHIHVDGMMRMRQLNDIVIGQGEALEFRPGGLHLMLFIENAEAADKSRSVITFHSPNCGDVTHAVPIRRETGKPSLK